MKNNKLLRLDSKRHSKINKCIENIFKPSYKRYKENSISTKEIRDIVIDKCNLKYSEAEKRLFTEVICNKMFNTFMKKEYSKKNKDGKIIQVSNPSYIAGLGWYVNKVMAYFYIIQTEKEAEEIHKHIEDKIKSKKKAEYIRQGNYQEHLLQLGHKKSKDKQITHKKK